MSAKEIKQKKKNLQYYKKKDKFRLATQQAVFAWSPGSNSLVIALLVSYVVRWEVQCPGVLFYQYFYH